MRSKAATCICFVLCLVADKSSFAQECECVPWGSGQKGTSIYFGYNGYSLDYSSPSSGAVQNHDVASLQGLELTLRGDDAKYFSYLSLGWSKARSATYNDRVNNTSSETADTHEIIANAELTLGFKTMNFSTITVAPYFGIGYVMWTKDMPAYKEEYKWPFGEIGLNFTMSLLSNRLLLSVDGAIQIPYNPTMTTNVGGQYDDTTFNINTRPGYRFEAPVTFNLYKGKDSTFFLFVKPYFQRWYLGNSDTKTYTLDGNDTGIAAHVISSTTDVQGFKTGFGFNY